GSTIAFAAVGTKPLAPGDPAPANVFETYVRQIASGRTILISRASGPDGAALPAGPGFAEMLPTGITADGGCVTFDAPGSLVAGPASDSEEVFMRVLTPNCGRPAPANDGGGDPTADGSGGGSGGGGGASAPDHEPPRLTHVKLSRTTFRVGSQRTALSARARPGVGTVLSLTVSEPSTLTLYVYRERPGRKAGTKRTAVCRVVAKAPR